MLLIYREWQDWYCLIRVQEGSEMKNEAGKVAQNSYILKRATSR